MTTAELTSGVAGEHRLDLAELDPQTRSFTWSSLRPEYSRTGLPRWSYRQRTTSPVRYIRSPGAPYGLATNLSAVTSGRCR